MDNVKVPIFLLVICIAVFFAFANPFAKRGTPTQPKPIPGSTSSANRPVSSQDRSEALAKARKALDQNDFPTMLQVLAPFVQEDDAAIQGLLGFAYAGEKDFESAAGAFQKALQKKRDPVFGYSLAYVYETLGEMEKARDHYQDLTRAKIDQRTKAKIFLGKARTSLFLNEQKAAFSAFQQAVNVDPTSAEAVEGLLRLMRITGEVANLDALRKKAEPLHGESFSYRFWLGAIYFDQGKFEDSLVHFRKATALDKTNSSPFYFIYRILRRNRQVEQAVEELEQYYARNPFLPYIFFQAALDAKSSQRLDLAFKFLRSAITMDRSLLGHDDKGTLFAIEKHIKRQGTPDEKAFMEIFSKFINSEFEVAYREMQALLPKFKDVRLREDGERLIRECQSIFVRQNQYNSYMAQIQAEQSEAMARIRQRVAQANRNQDPVESPLDSIKRQALSNPRDLKLQYGTALKLARMGDLQGAKVFLRETLRLNPKVHEAYYSLAKIAQFEGNTQQASDYLRDALQHSPGSSQALSLSASLLYDQGDQNRAREHAQGALRSNPNNTEARLVLAKINQQEGRTREALEEIDLALANEADPGRRSEFMVLKRQLGGE